ncbi:MULTISPECIES: hypothetical protein [unclassified Nocardioides]|uniref:hypothetical protein n=1 Tax=unclassified Nocardioides TaxID=2615069 RepID=UPI0009EFA16C|nr:MULTISPECIES: hypothetical protein [unclassified Nocardioides]GAW51044.1 hypothetical protein PD653B2_3380 [Nocardioides sp. PD653-B2]GAW54003.1 hypothetical protein PD653_1410 [Nocardioides sp. PD653]
MTQVYPPTAAPAPRGLDVDRPTVALGVALLSTAVVLSTYYTRLEDHLDRSNYVVGLVATAGLLGIAAAALVGVVVPRDADATTDLVAWPGAFGALGVGLMIGVGLDDAAATEYVAGAAVLLVSIAGYLLVQRAPFVVTAIVGFFVVYAQLLDDVVGFGDDDDIGAIRIAVALTVFAVLVTGAGWLLPTRALSGVVAGAVTVVGFASLSGVLAVASSFQAALAPMMAQRDYAAGGGSGLGSYDNDTWVILALALLLMVGWGACAARTGHVGFRLLVVAMAVSVTPLATVVLRAEHPTWWGVVLGAVGGALLVYVLVRSSGRSFRRQQATLPGAGGPPPYVPPTSPPPAGPPPTSPPPTSPPLP